MSQQKSSQSGLRTVTRDFSSNTKAKDEPISWPKTNEPRGQRFKDIEAGISQREVSIPPQSNENENVAPTHIVSGSKRLLEIALEDLQAPKKRQLPPNWQEDPPTRSPYFSNASYAKNPKALSQTRAEPITLANVTSNTASKIVLSQEQTQILQLVEQGKSLFYTGSAGTGKSVLLREIIKSLQKRYCKSPDAVAITASTGIAACNIGGVTIHSFSGIGIGEGSAEDLSVKVRKNRKATSRWIRTKVLIIDEVSMLDGDLFDKLAKLGSIIRKSSVPFGGIQVVVTGDFFQLPPVSKGSSAAVKFAFEAQCWSQTIQRTFNLTKVFRQKDEEFVNMLNDMRFGKLSSLSIDRFKSLSRAIDYRDGIGPTELFPRREDVDRSNQSRMASLTAEEKQYTATDGGSLKDPNQREKILSNFMAPKRLVLRVGAQVMLIKNMDETLVNGSMGKVVRFVQPQFYRTEFDEVNPNEKPKSEKKKPTTNDMFCPVVEFILPNRTTRQALIEPETWRVEQPDGDVQVSRIQLPLILAWAMSIHKSQGQTLERVKVDLARVFEKGQAYVALSRATSLDGLQVLNFNATKVQAHPKVVEWSKTLETIID